MPRSTGPAQAAAADRIATLAQAQAQAQVLPVPPTLHLEGTPPVPMALVAKVQRYTQFAGHGVVDWHPQRAELLVGHRLPQARNAQIFRLEGPLGPLQRVTQSAEPVRQATFEPRSGAYVVYAQSQGGNEAAQLYRLMPGQTEGVRFTEDDERHGLSGWLRHSGRLLYISVPLDRTASGGSRAKPGVRVTLIDPAQPETTRRVVAQLEGPGWGVRPMAPPDEAWVIAERFVSVTESEIHRLDLATGRSERVLPRPLQAGATPGVAHKAARWDATELSPDGRTLYLMSDVWGEFSELAAMDLATGELRRLSAQIPWDIEQASLSADGRLLAFVANADGRSALHLIDAASGAPLTVPPVPVGGIGGIGFHPKLPLLVLGGAGARGPGQVFVSTVGPQGAGPFVAWTRPHVPDGIDTSGYREAEVIRWKSFDGRTISGLIHRPPARFTGKRPVWIDIHGGPEAQATVGFLGRVNYLVQELGVVVIEPNVRGSTGYGKTFTTLDNGYLREDSVKDIGALLDWIETQPDLDARRVLVEGGSYGGYMTMAVAMHYPDRIVAAMPAVGPSNFVTFLENTESYRRDLRRVEYGDERDPAMRAFQQRIAPANNTHRMKRPMMFTQGRNDPRVPASESEQMLGKLRAQGVPVWYVRGENEGHGFANKDNADYQYYLTLLFAQQHLLEGAALP